LFGGFTEQPPILRPITALNSWWPTPEDGESLQLVGYFWHSPRVLHSCKIRFSFKVWHS